MPVIKYESRPMKKSFAITSLFVIAALSLSGCATEPESQDAPPASNDEASARFIDTAHKLPGLSSADSTTILEIGESICTLVDINTSATDVISELRTSYNLDPIAAANLYSEAKLTICLF